MQTHIGRVGAFALGLTLAGGLGMARSAFAIITPISCDQTTLAGIAPPNSFIDTAVPVAAVVGPPAVPAYCNVTGHYVDSLAGTTGSPNNVDFQLALPDPAVWNGKFLFLGNGGFAGSIQADVTLGFPYATAATDTGHQSTSELDGSWALNNQLAQDDFGYRGVHFATLVSEDLSSSYYANTVPTESYFDGCSDGGREALVEAEQFPTDFNGIIAGDPAIGTLLPGFNWNYQALFKTIDSWIPADKLQMVDQAVMNECDTKDGVIDGLIQDPRKCAFDPATLKCPASDPTPDTDPTCLSKGQVQALKAIYKGLVTKKGVQVYPGYTQSDPGEDLDSLSDATGWGEWITGLVRPTIPVPVNGEPWGGSLLASPLQWSFQDQELKYFFANSASYDSLTFDVNTDLARFLETSTVGGSQGDNARALRNFQREGGKLIMYHGWSDPAVSPLESVRFYHNQLIGNVFSGNATAVRRFARLFMVPGMHHCGGGPGPNVFDMLAPLDNWVTHGKAPDSVVAMHYSENDPTTFIDRSMPLCAFPETAHLIGGNVFVASSWKCF
jgi:feruloyl esterase